MRSLKSLCLRPRAAALAPVMAICLGAFNPAHADTLLLADTTLVTGPETSDFSFVAPTAGTVTADITNLAWPTQLSSLTFSATSASSTLTPISNTASGNASQQIESFQVSAGNYFAHVTATPAAGTTLGLYSLALTFSPSGNAVPLPASGWLLISAGGLLFVLMRSSGALRSWMRWRTMLRSFSLAFRELEAR